jgi:hypothetical protein
MVISKIKINKNGRLDEFKINKLATPIFISGNPCFMYIGRTGNPYMGC